MSESATVAGRLSDDQLHEYARSAYLNAVESRRDLEELKRQHLDLYRAFSRDIAKGGKGSEEVGPFGWSKLVVPISFWIVETILPRLALNLPRAIATPDSPSAVPYAVAKQMRINRQMARAKASREITRAIKNALIFGDGPVKVTWNRYFQRPNIMSTGWFDVLLSAGASRHWHAEWIFHRVRYSPHDLVELSKVADSDGRPMYRNLEQCLGSSGASDDPTFTERLQTAGLSQYGWHDLAGMTEFIECHHRDGSIVVLGAKGEILVRTAEGPYKLPMSYQEIEDKYPTPTDPMTDGTGQERPGLSEGMSDVSWRPFAFLSNTPDIEGPYGISDVEMQQDYQREMSTVRRQATDQAAANIHAPIAYNSDVLPNDVDRAFSRPGGKIKVNGDVRSAIVRLTGGQMSQDVERLSDMIRAESQLVSGISDYTAGQAGGPGLNNTATGITKTIEEANQRWRFKQFLIEQDFGDVACMVDWLDRQYGGNLSAPPDRRAAMGGQEGFESIADGKLYQLGVEANRPGHDFDITIEAGSLTPANQLEQSQNILALVGALSSNPEMAMRVDWDEITQEVISAHGVDAERIYRPMPPQPTQAPDGSPVAAGPPPEGAQPVGAAIPMNGGQ